MAAVSEDPWQHTFTVQFVQHIASLLGTAGPPRITLQFPDDLLAVSLHVHKEVASILLHAGINARLYVLADNTYHSTAVDEVAAAHVDAHAVVQYGRCSLATPATLPTFCQFGAHPVDVPSTATALHAMLREQHAEPSAQFVVLLTDQPYYYAAQQLQGQLQQQLAQPGHATQVIIAHPRARLLLPRQRPPWLTLDFPETLLRACNHKTQQPGSTHSTTEADAAAAGRTAARGGGSDAAAHGTTDTRENTEGHGALPQALGAAQGGAETETDGGRKGVFGCSGMHWSLPESAESARCVVCWVGPLESNTLQHAQLQYHQQVQWLAYDPASNESSVGLARSTMALLKRRYFLIEKARAANIVGLLVGTLSSSGHREALQRLRQLAIAAGKRTYSFLVGKPNPAKLGNFPEVDVFVMVADEDGQLLDCKDYLTPVITPQEAEIAFTKGAHWNTENITLGFQHLSVDSETPGGSMECPSGAPEDEAAGDMTLLVPAKLAIVQNAAGTGALVDANSAAEYFLLQRSFRGLETPAGGAEVKQPQAAVQGQTGRAAMYTHEPV